MNTISAFSPFMSLFTSSMLVESQHSKRCGQISNRSPSTISVWTPSSTSKSSSSAVGSSLVYSISSHHSTSSSVSHSLANISQSHSQPDTLSLIKNSLSCSSVRLSATMTGISFIHASLQALNRILPHLIYPAGSTTST